MKFFPFQLIRTESLNETRICKH